MAALQLLLSALLVCQVYSAPTISPTVTADDKQHLNTTEAETSSRTKEIIRNSEESLPKLAGEPDEIESKVFLPNTEYPIKTTIVEQEHIINPDKTTDTIKESTGISEDVDTESITENLSDDRVILDTESTKSVINGEEIEINDKPQDVPTVNREYPTTDTVTEEFSIDPIRTQMIEDGPREEDMGEISPDPIPDYVSESQADEIIDGPIPPESEIDTPEMMGTRVFPEFVPEENPDEPIEPPVDETSMEEEEEEMEPNPPSVIPDDSLVDVNDGPLPVALDIIEEVPDNPPEKIDENEDSGPINII